MFTRDSVLKFLDTAFQRIEMPCFGNMNIDYIASRLSVYRSSDQWLLMFNSVVWWPAGEGLMAMVEMVGPGVVGSQGFDHGRSFVPGCIEVDHDRENILSITIRGDAIDPLPLTIQPNYEIQPDYGFWVAIALAETYKESLLASPSEVEPFIPPDFQHLLTLDQWDHPTWDTPPSQTETFPSLAQVLVTGDPSQWQPVAVPNSHWSQWQPK
ncbi:DUF7003 family protein [Prochlorothrix hollandica]|nr:hypothetical protein [Prochlorothrix hollandica]